MPDFTGVELARIGTYNLSQGGERTFARADLAAAAAHAAAGHVPRIKLGHVDPRFDGEPALGRVENLRVSDDGDVLLGDLAGMPGWLRDALPTAYPGRSLEARSSGDGDLRIHSLALLGIAAPAIDTLKDLEYAVAASEGADVQMFAAVDGDDKPLIVLVERELRAAGPATHEPPEAVQDAASRGLELVAAGRGGDGLTEGAKARARSLADGDAQTLDQARRMVAYFDRHDSDRSDGWDTAGEETPGYVAWQLWGGDPGRAWAKTVIDAASEDLAAAGIDVDQLRAAYEEAQQGAAGPLSPWVQDVFVDPNELIVRDGQRLFRVGWSWDETAQRFEFGASTEVRVEYVDVAASAPTTVTITPDSRRPNPKEGPMTPQELRAALKLPDDATDDQVNEAIAASLAATADMTMVREQLELPDDATAEQVKAKLAEQPVAASAAQVTLDRRQYEELKASAKLGATAHETLARRDADTDRDTYLRSKVRDGTLHADSVAQGDYDELFASAGAERAQAAIDAMPSGVVPYLERIEVTVDDELAAAGALQLPDDGSVPEGLSLLTPAERAQLSAS